MSLYVDDRTELPESEWRTGEYGGKEFKIITIGKKWSWRRRLDMAETRSLIT